MKPETMVRIQIVMVAILVICLLVIATANIMRLLEPRTQVICCPAGYQYNPADGMCWRQAERLEQR